VKRTVLFVLFTDVSYSMAVHARLVLN